MKKPINPFDLLDASAQMKPAVSESSAMTSTSSSVQNLQHGVCPKCGAPMETVTVPASASMKSNEPVFWCGLCRVAAPKPLE
jgi:hypothetical protein